MVDQIEDAATPQPHQAGGGGQLPRTWVDVDLSAVRHNTAVLTPPHSDLLVMIKGNGFGHGAVEIARTVLAAGAHWLGASFIADGIELRSASPDAPILVTTEALPGEEEPALRASLDMTVYSQDAINRLGEASRRVGTTPRVHIKLNTGLNRVGAPPKDAVALTNQAVAAGLEVRGLWTHFANSEQLDDPTTDAQLHRLLAAAAALEAAGHRRPRLHAANTAAILAHPSTHLDLVRAGIGIFGFAPDAALPRAGELIPALSWCTSVRHVKRLDAGQGVSYGFTARTSKPTTVATLPVGYFDGYPRCLSNRGDVLIRGRRCRVLGAIAMDQMLIDCADEPIEVGDEVVLIGAQGDQTVTALELATAAGTVVDEILGGISARAPRFYRT